jgi:hypothetical protein
MIVIIRNQTKTRSRMGNCTRGARVRCAPMPDCGQDQSGFRFCFTPPDKLDGAFASRPFRHSHRPSVSGSRASIFSLRRWSSNSVAHRRSIRFLPYGSVATLSLGRAIFGCCPRFLNPTHHVARQSIDAPENHLRRLSSVVRYGPNVARGSEKHVPEIEE